MNISTASDDDLARWIVANASLNNIEEWAERWLFNGYDSVDLRKMAREVEDSGEVRGNYDLD